MTEVVGRLRLRLVGLFYRTFFHLLLLFASSAQWGCAAWILYVAAGAALPVWVHGLGAAGWYAFNRGVVKWRGGPLRAVPSTALRVYSAVAFVAVFCFGFLLASGALWVAACGVLGALTAPASATVGRAGIGHGLDGGFQWFVSLGMAGIGLTMLYGYAVGQRELRVTVVPLSLGGLTGAARRLRIAQISDIHVGQNLTPAQLRGFVAQVNALQPDLICVTGDTADSPLADFGVFFPVLGQLRARYGVYAILGNHDHYAGADRVVAELRRWTDFRVLRDEAVTLDLDGVRLHLIGLDDRGRDWARGVVSDARLAELLAAAPRGVPVLLLSHRPDIFNQAAAAGVVLTLSGHTHGGQIALPWFGGRRRNLAEFITPFDRGLYCRDASYLYVNCGLGVTGQRIRLFTPREISVVELPLAV